MSERTKSLSAKLTAADYTALEGRVVPSPPADKWEGMVEIDVADLRVRREPERWLDRRRDKAVVSPSH